MHWVRSKTHKKNAYLDGYLPKHVRVVRSTANINLNADMRRRIFYIQKIWQVTLNGDTRIVMPVVCTSSRIKCILTLSSFRTPFEFRAATTPDQPPWKVPLNFADLTPRQHGTLSPKDSSRQMICCLQRNQS